jgi:hypothetical protein
MKPSRLKYLDLVTVKWLKRVTITYLIIVAILAIVLWGMVIISDNPLISQSNQTHPCADKTNAPLP